jgi:alpha-beta hydrolase superfamily lysophospholipase
METVRSKDGTTIAYDRRGSGPPVVLVGGALSDRRGATGLAEALAPRMTAISFDRRGRGDSTDTGPYAVDREIEDLAAVMEAAGATSVYGHSSGAVLSLRAAEAGLSIERLAVYEPPFILDDTRPPLPADYSAHTDELIAAGRSADAVEYFLRTGPMVPEAVITRTRESPAWAGLTAMAATIGYDNRVLGDMMAGDPAPLGRWSSVAIPTLVLAGGASPPFIQHGAAILTAVLPGAVMQVLDGQTHGASPDVLAPVLMDFFLDRD